MLNYTLRADDANNVNYMMKAGRDWVYCQMPHGNALRLCEQGTVTVGEIEDFPIAVDGKYFFAGEIHTDAPVESPAEETGKSKRPKRREKGENS